jgi:hypothetical protein
MNVSTFTQLDLSSPTLFVYFSVLALTVYHVLLTSLVAVCWICSGDWRSHQSCNKFQGSKDSSDDRAALERYLHYYHRYTVHENSKKLEGKLREQVLHSLLSEPHRITIA